MKVREERVLAGRRLAKSGGQMGKPPLVDPGEPMALVVAPGVLLRGGPGATWPPVRRASRVEPGWRHRRCKYLGVPPYRLPWLIAQVGRGFRRAIQSIEFHDGIPELLEELRGRGLKLMILSTNDAGSIRAFLKRHSVEEWVEDIHCSSSLFGKARLLRTLMKRAGLQRDQLVYVGDEHRDVEPCRKVGVKVIAVRWGFDAEVRLVQAGPDYIADHPAETAECVGRWAARTPEAHSADRGRVEAPGTREP